MTLDLTFKEVCSFIKKDGEKDPKLIEAVDKLLGFAMICSPIFLGPSAAAFLPSLAVKNELIKIGKGIFDKFTKQDDNNYVSRQQRMQVAYGLLCFTSFFEALDKKITINLRKKIILLPEEKAFIAESASGEAITSAAKACGCIGITNPLTEFPLSFPHPIESFESQIQRHTDLWKQMGQGFLDFLQKLSFWNEITNKERTKIISPLKDVPKDAAVYFEAQYFELARQYEEFAIWANLQEHKRTKELIGNLSLQVQQHTDLAVLSSGIDIGFSKLHETVLGIPELLKIQQAVELVESLSNHYQARINDPIIDDKEDDDENKPRLAFPRIREAFIPQSFCVLRQTGKIRRLEDEATWHGLERRSDLGAFMLSYLRSPYSTESPLLILGHPGSGKSLLTTVLSAQLMSKHFSTIRVPLREVNAEAGIVAQIEEAIHRITNISVDSWAKLSSTFKNSPPLIILDGYDELLQASGKVFSSYLKEVQNFQKSESEQGRPLRAIVTSTL